MLHDSHMGTLTIQISYNDDKDDDTIDSHYLMMSSHDETNVLGFPKIGLNPIEVAIPMSFQRILRFNDGCLISCYCYFQLLPRGYDLHE